MVSSLMSNSFYMSECKRKKLFKMISKNILFSGYVTVLDLQSIFLSILQIVSNLLTVKL